MSFEIIHLKYLKELAEEKSQSKGISIDCKKTMELLIEKIKEEIEELNKESK